MKLGLGPAFVVIHNGLPSAVPGSVTITGMYPTWNARVLQGPPRLPKAERPLAKHPGNPTLRHP